ncbi:MAG: enoyl-CoA hydratase/isomerase family protein, partial [Blastocatellia bacterium]|nr:enoyl-CoA hydratase/isomerase family protein [Blastocatellia bacterium]
KPVIAAVSGYAVAGGMELALWCDLRVVEKSAIFGIFNRRWGIPLIDGGTVRLPRIIGMGRALDLILTGRPVAADEALAIGLANRVVEDGSSREEAEKLALQIAEFPEVCTLQDRLSLYEQAAMGLTEAMENEFKHGLKTIEETNIFKSASLFVEGKGRHGSFSNNL